MVLILYFSCQSTAHKEYLETTLTLKNCKPCDEISSNFIANWCHFYKKGVSTCNARLKIMLQRLRWPGFGKNTQNEAELWLGFLDFYSREFNYQKHVVCIRQTGVVTKVEKLWNSDKLAIEDPFNTAHNLGIGLTKKSKKLGTNSNNV